MKEKIVSKIQQCSKESLKKKRKNLSADSSSYSKMVSFALYLFSTFNRILKNKTESRSISSEHILPKNKGETNCNHNNDRFTSAMVYQNHSVENTYNKLRIASKHSIRRKISWNLFLTTSSGR